MSLSIDQIVMDDSSSFTFTLSGRSSILRAQYFPPIELSAHKSYALGLCELLTFNSIPNIDVHNNTFNIDGRDIVLPTGSYEITDIEKFLQKNLSKDTSLVLLANNATLRVEIQSNRTINFESNNSIGRLLGFGKVQLKPNKTHISTHPVEILKINALRIECNIIQGAYINNQKARTLHEFFPAVPAGFKIIEVPSKIIYLPLTTRTIDNIELRIVDQNGDLVNFRGEVITIRLHLKG